MRSSTLLPLSLLLLAPPALLVTLITSNELKTQILIIALVSLATYFFLITLIPKHKNYLLRADLCGIDLNKLSSSDERSSAPKIPEALGVVSGVVYVTILVFLQLFYVISSTHPPDDHKELRLFHTNTAHTLIQYNSSLACILFMILLGFIDDVVDLPWRYKLILPSVATLPLLITYTGSTSIILPRGLTAIFGVGLLDLGILYKVYMGLLAVFATNSINIYAGINGLEVGQSLVIAIAIACHNLIEIAGHNPEVASVLSSGLTYQATIQSNHLFSLFLILPFIACCFALLKYNWYPSSIFIGDTFTYQAGMTFAVVGILGHFSKTLLLFFIPQILNFLISIPQIFRLFGITCPRHRLPKYDAKTGKLKGQSYNHNLLNFTLCLTGPMKEEHICALLLIMQVICCALGFFVRYCIADFFFIKSSTTILTSSW